MCHTNLERVLVTLHESQIQDFKVLPNIGVFGILFFFSVFPVKNEQFLHTCDSKAVLQ